MTIEQHNKIISRMAKGAMNNDDLSKLQNLLLEHIRFVAHVLFNEMQQVDDLKNRCLFERQA